MIEEKTESKPLTLGQQLHLAILFERVAAAQTNIAAYMDYLRDECAAPAREGWQLKDLRIGFTKEGS